MLVPMMQVREMWMHMRYFPMPVGMRVRLPWHGVPGMRVLMMGIMGMKMVMLEGGMVVRMFVMLRQMEPHTQAHQQGGPDESDC